jgi:hypothetical protein
MKNKIHKKAMVFGIIVILFCSTFFPGISSKKVNPVRDKIINNETLEVEEEVATLTFNTFNENGKKENKIDLPLSKAKYIFNLFEILRNMTISYPNSQETLDLKNRFIDLLEEYGLIPRGMSKSDIQPLINPHGTPDNPKTRGRTGFLGLIFEILFSNRFNHLRLLGPLDYPSEWSIVCNVASYGYGIPLPLFILPRPRFITVWGATDATTAVGSLLMPKSFVAMGNQQGICLGFVGVGITIAFFGFIGYGMLGYSLYTAVRAQEIERYNNEPTITNENPSSGSTNVSTSLSELSFRLTDGDGDLMTYTVTTSPDIGGSYDNNKGNGVYSVPVGGLDSDTDYTWYVTVDDGYDTVEKTFTFKTEYAEPVVSNPSPIHGAKDVPVNLTEISFHLEDYQGDLMDYTVTTEPDIGFGSGSGVGNGTYSISVSGLDCSTTYRWYVHVTDGEYETKKNFCFNTEYVMVLDPFDMGWQYRKMITINHSMVDGDFENFSMLISLTDADLRDKAQSDGDDILFMDGPGVANRLYHEIEYFNGGSGELIAWVNVTSLSSGVDTVLYMYYGNPGYSSQQFPERVWDSDFLTVLHMNDPSGNPYDSTRNHEKWQVKNGGTLTYHATGQVGYAIKGEFDVNDGNRFENFGMDWTGLNAVTIDWWFAPHNITQHSMRFGADGKNEEDIRSYYSYNSETQESGWGENWDDGTERPLDGRSYNWNNGEFHHGAVIMDNAGSNYHGLYTDGALTISSSPSNFHFANLNNQYYIGSRVPERGKDNNFDGWLDEFRISKVRRSDAWISTSYNTMNDPSGFFNVGPEESAP